MYGEATSAYRRLDGAWWMKREPSSGRWFFVDATTGDACWDEPPGAFRSPTD